MVYDNDVWGRWCATKLCVKDGVCDSAMSMCDTRPEPEPAQCHKCHACHAKRNAKCRGDPGRPTATKRATRASPVPEVPRQSRKTKVDVAKCHACRQVPHQARKVPRRTGNQWRPSAPPEPAHCKKRHASHAKRTGMSPSATPATQSTK